MQENTTIEAPLEADTQKRRQILEGARVCFMAQGFDGASMNDIVKAAGVSKATVYAYFPSKENLFETMIFEERRRDALMMTDIGGDGRPLPEVLRDLALRFLNRMMSEDWVASTRMAIGAAAKFPAIGRAMLDGGLNFSAKQIADYFEVKMREGQLRHGDAELLAMQFLDIIQSGITKPRLFGHQGLNDRLGMEPIVDAAIDLFLRGAQTSP